MNPNFENAPFVHIKSTSITRGNDYMSSLLFKEKHIKASLGTVLVDSILDLYAEHDLMSEEEWQDVRIQLLSENLDSNVYILEDWNDGVASVFFSCIENPRIFFSIPNLKILLRITDDEDLTKEIVQTFLT